jgi:hypothetical protein
MLELREAGRLEKRAPLLEVVVRPVPAAIPALLVVASRVRAEEHAFGPQRRAQFPEDARQLPARDVEEGGVGEDAVESFRGELQGEEILLPHLALAVRARHVGEPRRALEAGRLVAQRAERGQVAPGSAPEVEECGRAASARMWRSSASMFCVTSWVRVPSQKSSARSS